MKYLTLVFVLILAFVVFSCNNEKTERYEPDNESAVTEEEKGSIPELYTQTILDENKEIIKIIKDFEVKIDDMDRSGDIIYYIKKINMGIPGGDTWFVAWIYTTDGQWTGALPFIYIVDDNEVIKRYDDPIFSLSNPLGRITFDIMADIPGERIGEMAASISDYSGDGYDEILSFFFGGRANQFTITGYDPKEDRLINYCDIYFDIADKTSGPPPVKFITYNGLDGMQFENYDDNGRQQLSFYFWKNNPTRLVQLEIYKPE
jgi:hypothetical protein